MTVQHWIYTSYILEMSIKYQFWDLKSCHQMSTWWLWMVWKWNIRGHLACRATCLANRKQEKSSRTNLIQRNCSEGQTLSTHYCWFFSIKTILWCRRISINMLNDKCFALFYISLHFHLQGEETWQKRWKKKFWKKKTYQKVDLHLCHSLWPSLCCLIMWLVTKLSIDTREKKSSLMVIISTPRYWILDWFIRINYMR